MRGFEPRERTLNDTPSDATLVRQALAGQNLAYAQLARRWAGRVMAVCHSRVGNADSAEELAQETLCRGLQGLSTLQDPDRFGSWLCGIAVRTCLDWHKSKSRTEVSMSALHADRPTPDVPQADSRSTPETTEQCRRVVAAVEALPEKLREIIMLYYYNDVTYQDLAGMLGVSSATVNARLTQARAALRERLGAARS